MSGAQLKLVLLLGTGALFALGCSLSLNVTGPGDTPATPTTIEEGVNRAVERTLTAIGEANNDLGGSVQATPDATEIAVNVTTLVAEALLTLQPTAEPPVPTQAAPRATLPPPPPPPAATDVPPPPPPTELPTPTNTPEPTSTPIPTDTPTQTPTDTPTPTNTFTPTIVPTHCPQEYCIIMQRCEPGENTRAVGTIYEHDLPKNGVRVRVSYAAGGPPLLPDFISGRDPINPAIDDPNRPGYYQFGLLEGGALQGDWWVFVVNDEGDVLSVARYLQTHGQQTGSSCQVGITDFYR